MAVVLTVAAVLLGCCVIVAGLASGTPVAAVVGAVAAPLLALVLAALLAWTWRNRLTAWARQWLVEVAGTAIVRSMPPRTVLAALLNRVFGEKIGHDEITTALFGGGGNDVAGRDIAVSRRTTARVSLERIDESSCLTELTWSHEFSGVRDNHRLVMFATSDSEIFSLLTSRRVYPLFEAFFEQTEEQLENFVPGIKDRLEVGIDYRDADGFIHTISPKSEQGEEVALRDYDQYVRLPESIDRKELRIFQLDLHDLADPDHVVETVERLTLRASTIGAFDQGFITWAVPHPCFVESIVFDVRNLTNGSEKLVYQIIVNTVQISYSALPQRGVWTYVPDEIEVPVRSWMLPGHGVTLLWRQFDGAETPYGTDGF